MNSARKRYSALFALLLMLTWQGAQAVPGYVLCFGADGHVELEPALNGSCTALEALHLDENIECAVIGPEHQPHDDHCGACRDIPLLQSNNATTSNRSSEKPVSNVHTASRRSTPNPEDLPVAPAFQCVFQNSETQQAHRSTVLLI